MLGKRKKLTPHQEELQRQLHKKQHLLKHQERLKAIETYLTNMHTMLQDSVSALQAEAYPTDGLMWLLQKGFPVLQQKIQREQRTLQEFVTKQNESRR